ncbi:MAG: hypothetical protein M9938_03035 [Solirubrobacterales bacterium]|nr:hypothetical protein [Solirubrobacterales bacterium]
MRQKTLILIALTAALAGMVAVAGPAAGADPAVKCPRDNSNAKTITVGIVKLVGCFEEDTVKGAKVYTADPDRQPYYGATDKRIQAVDMNGFLIDGRKPDGDARNQGWIKIDTGNSSIRYQDRDGGALPVQLAVLGPKEFTSEPTRLGEPFKLNFTAPKTGSLTLEDLRFFSNATWVKALAGFSPAPDIETPIRLLEGGKGSMDLSLRLAGWMTLKGRPQSATVAVPTEVGEGAHVDGFELKLEKIDGIKLITINGLEAKYSASEKSLGGGADFSLPFMGDRGISFEFEVEDSVLTKAAIGASGLEIPIGAPPAGTISAMSGGFGFKKVDDQLLLNLSAAATAEFGPKVPSPWGKLVPLEVNSSLKIGKERNDFYFFFDGGLKVFRLPAGSVYLKIRTATGVEFGFNIGIGFPSYSNNPEDPFYIGTKVDGWVAKQKFQFEGRGKVRLIGLDIFDGRILINNRAAGACWKVTWFDGGAVYEYGAKEVKTFGVSCGLDHYREKFPAAASAGVAAVSAERPRKLTTGPREVVLSARGKGGAPRFRLTAPDGRNFTVPKGRDVVRTKRYMIVVDRRNRVTHVAAGSLANGRWTITPYADSAPIMGVKTGKALRPEKVRARIVGRGLSRTLTWNSRGNPHTKLSFTEVMQDGSEKPILVTDRVRGRYRFTAAKGGAYGNRRLRAYVVHGGTPREVTVEDRYVVRRPSKLRAPRVVHAWRNNYTAVARWQAVPGARGYLAEVAVVRNGRRLSAYRRVVSPKRHSIRIPSHPGGSWAVANVQALNADGVPGRVGTRKFRLSPPNRISLREAGRRSADSAVRRGGKIRLRVVCPVNGHCQTRVLLRLNGRTVGRTTFQQVPDTFRTVDLAPDTPRLRRLLAQGRLKRIRVIVRQHRIGGRSVSLGDTVGTARGS